MQISKAGYIAGAAIMVAAAAAGFGLFTESPSAPESTLDGAVALSSRVPADVTAENPVGDHSYYDTFSWKSFVSLNWPVRADGRADAQTIGANGDNATVWGVWMEDYRILVADGETPPAWGTPPVPPPACQAIGAAETARVLYHATKAEGVVSSSVQAQAGPLIDLNASYVRYEIVVNRLMYDYIVANRLYTQAGLKAFGTIDFPARSRAMGAEGATMVKAAWKPLGDGDDPARFHTIDAYVVSGDQCARMRLGLVGMHISTKTESAPQWIWSTFEHVDNAPDAGADKSGHYNFYDPDCLQSGSGESCTPNALPDTPWDPTRPGQVPVQVVRVTPVDAETAALNAKFQAELKKANPDTVWANYMLIGTQYPQKPTDTTDPTGRPFPPYLANTAIETFMQGDTPMVSSSCIGCHNRATATPAAKPSDFTYILSRVMAKE